jgi:hypothetical protein
MLEEAATPTHGLGHGKGVKQPKALSMPKVLQEFEMSSDVESFWGVRVSMMLAKETRPKNNFGCSTVSETIKSIIQYLRSF